MDQLSKTVRVQGIVGLFRLPRLYIIGVFFRGVHPSLLRDVPAVIYTLTVALAVWLAGRGRRDRRSAWLGMAVTFILMGLPAGFLAHFIFLRK